MKKALRSTVGLLIKSFVVFHVEGHSALLALETRLVPQLVQALDLLHGVDRLFALGTSFRIHGVENLSKIKRVKIVGRLNHRFGRRKSAQI